MNTKPYIENGDDIKASPLFQLSLGSKELFHSNFIAWISEKYPKEVGNLLSSFLKDQTGDISLTKVRREFKNVDIHLYFKNGQELIIENKVKSIPYREQLERYSQDKSSNQNFILLTLTRPDFAKSNKIDISGTAWNVFTYADFADLLKQLLPQIDDPYDSFILKDYISFISFLHDVMADIEVKDSNLFNFYNPAKDSKLAVLQDLRMADVYLKMKYQMLGKLVYNKLSSQFLTKQVHFNVSVEKHRRVGELYVGYGMSRSMGLMEVVYVIKEGLFLTTQLQDNHYRQMVQGYAGYGPASKEFAHAIKEQGVWFDFKNVPGNIKEYPSRKDKIFNKYGHTDFYRSVRLSSSLTIEQVVNLILSDVEKMLSVNL